MILNPLKHRLCNYFCENGHTIIPSGEEAKHLVRGSNKPVPTLVLIARLINAGVDFIRMISFGMKPKRDTFPAIPRDLLSQNAVDHGFPLNEWDVSLSGRTQSLYLIKPLPPYPYDITINPYPILTPLNPNPRVTLGGNLNIVMDPLVQVLRLKIYNLQFHLLRAWDSQLLTTPVSNTSIPSSSQWRETHTSLEG
jgi:hypothetical protein